MIRILVVDDQAMIRSGLRMILESEPDMTVIGEAEDGDSAVAAARRHSPDVILMDVRMPGSDGLEATRRILDGQRPHLPRIVVLTTFDADEYVYGALRAGASGFLLKDAPAEDLISALRVVARGDALLDPKVTRRVIEEFASRGGGSPAEGLSELTDRELEVLRLVAKGRSNAEIAEDLYVSETTVKTHVSHILAKLGLRDRVQAVVAAYESGVVRPGEG